MAQAPQIFHPERRRMIRHQLIDRGISDPAVLKAMEQVPRHLFVESAHQDLAYSDQPLPLPAGQTISQPFIVAYMIQSLKLEPTHKVLDVGSGCGYTSALLSRMVNQVFAIERLPSLYELSCAAIQNLGYRNIQFKCADGSKGWPEHAPFDAILVSATTDQLPEDLLSQLKVGGRLVLPFKALSGIEKLMIVTRNGPDSFDSQEDLPVRFVPLIRD